MNIPLAPLYETDSLVQQVHERFQIHLEEYLPKDNQYTQEGIASLLALLMQLQLQLPSPQSVLYEVIAQQDVTPQQIEGVTSLTHITREGISYLSFEQRPTPDKLLSQEISQYIDFLNQQASIPLQVTHPPVSALPTETE